MASWGYNASLGADPSTSNPSSATYQWASDLTSLSLSFPICKMGLVIIPTSQDHCEV